MRTDDDEPSPEATRRALRDVVGGCLYGVDVNPMAVELCGSLWMEALEPTDRSASSLPTSRDGCSDPPRTLVTHFIRATGHN